MKPSHSSLWTSKPLLMNLFESFSFRFVFSFFTANVRMVKVGLVGDFVVFHCAISFVRLASHCPFGHFTASASPLKTSHAILSRERREKYPIGRDGTHSPSMQTVVS